MDSRHFRISSLLREGLLSCITQGATQGGTAAGGLGAEWRRYPVDLERDRDGDTMSRLTRAAIFDVGQHAV
jgi:hypothetical protein